MPKRTNAFQDLIALLESQLAPAEARIFESKLLLDLRTGEEREVDIVIEGMIGHHPVRIGIEVIDHSRKASTPWIESIAQKHADLQIDKSIAVSRSGFFRPALVKALGLKIETLTIAEASSVDWKAKIDQIPRVLIESTVRSQLDRATVLIEEGFRLADLGNLNPDKLLLHSPAGERRNTLGAVLDLLLDDPSIVKALHDKAFDESVSYVDGEVRFAKGSFIIAPSGNKVLVAGIRFGFRIRKERTDLLLQKGRYRDSAVVVGEGMSVNHPVALAIVEDRGNDPVVTVRIRKPKSK